MRLLAHRGASADFPENTLEAMRGAMEQGADGVELDVIRCGSGELVVCHDEWLDRLAGLHWDVRETPWRKLKRLDVGSRLGFAPARIPLLAHAAWPDLLALLAALESKPRAAAKLLGAGDAGWSRSGRQRGATTRTAIRRAESIASGALGDEPFAQLRREGALLRSEDVDAIAFAAEDIS